MGTPSVMQQTVFKPAAIASETASAAKAAGTKIIEASAPVLATAVATELNTGRSKWVIPPLPGSDSANDLSTIVNHLLSVKGTFFAREYPGQELWYFCQ